MKTFEVYLNNREDNYLDSAIFVKQGFSFAAAFFQLFWCLYNKMWLAALSLFSAGFAISYLQKNSLISDLYSQNLAIAIFLLVGFEAKDWYVEKLKKANFRLEDVIIASSLDQARKQFFSKQLDQLYNSTKS